MKTTRFLPLILAALSALPLGAAVMTARPGFEPLKVVKMVDPVFPAGVQLSAITRGVVRCVIDVDQTGRLEDVLVTHYTHAAFGRVVEEAIREWTFEPARLNGQPVPAQTALEFTLQADGAVLSVSFFNVFEVLQPESWGRRFSYRPSVMKEIDRIPIPLQTVKPHYDVAMAEQKVSGRVTVDFYIDETGKVRMPIVGQSDHLRLSAAAVEAVRQWRFEPPVRNGRPTLVAASQEFDFEGKP